jgi:uncharacterized Fe-S cluster-containing radical SAM superfamily protein
MPIDTKAASARMRHQLLDPKHRRILLTNFARTQQERDLTEPPNCRGYGRIRHFRRQVDSAWVPNPLPIEPAARALGLGRIDELRAQVFQNAGCNWRCWYCYVPYKLLSANLHNSDWLSIGEMLDLLIAEDDHPLVIDLSGGEPSLTPEWVPWFLEELSRRRMEHQFYLWSDDNLSTDYFWRNLSQSQQELVATSRTYARVACFKGIDEQSFSYNTRADASQFDVQFELMGRLIASGMDVYAYVTFTTPTERDISGRVRRFVDKLQSLDPNLPLRTVPLEIRVFTPVVSRLNDVHKEAIQSQWKVLDAWKAELCQRFSVDLLSKAICDVPFSR